MQMTSDLASLIGSRICHDLISPIGAINNGLELMTMSGAQDGPEIGLIGESVGNASARIRFFRIAFGAAGNQLVGPVEIDSILRDQFGGSRLEVNWALDTPQPRTLVRLAFLAILCFESILPYGGRVDVAEVNGVWRLEGSAERVNVEEMLWSLLGGAAAEDRLLPAHVQFALLPLIAQECGRQVDATSSESGATICF